jgi:hypothetical protein
MPDKLLRGLQTLLVSLQKIISHKSYNNSDKYVPQISLDEAAAGVAIAAVGRLVLPLTFVHDGLGHVLELEPGLACTGV